MHRQGYNFGSICNLRAIVASGAVSSVVVTSRSSSSRMLSAFVNKFHVYGGAAIDSSDREERLAREFATLVIRWKLRRDGVRARDAAKAADCAVAPYSFSIADFLGFVSENGRRRHKLDAHFRPALVNAEDHSAVVDIFSRKDISVLPLRVESFDADLSSINLKLGTDGYLPPMVNSTRLPGPGWLFTDDPGSILKTVKSLQAEKVIPSKKALAGFFEQFPQLASDFNHSFAYDQDIRRRLDSLGST